MKTFTELLNEAAKEVNEIDIFQLKKLLDENYSFKLIDKNIEANAPDREEEIILYCAGGIRSILGCKSLQDMGYKKVFSLKGGIGDWINAEFPLVSND